MPEGIRGLEEIPFIPTTSLPIQTKRRTLPLHSDFASSSQCGLSKRSGRIATTVHFISRAFRGAEERYPRMEKLAFTLVTATQKLKPYLQAHTIIVLTNQPLKKAMSSPKAAGRMAL